MVQGVVCKNKYEKYKAQVIDTAVEKCYIFDDEEVPLYPTLVNKIVKRNWTASDIGKRAALVNAAIGLSTFTMADLTEEDVTIIQQYHEDLLNTLLVSTSELKATHTKLIPSTPTYSEGFIMMLKILPNLLFALFSSSRPLYKQVYKIIKALREYLPNARAALQQNTKTSILCILLLQARVFAQGIMVDTQGCLG